MTHTYRITGMTCISCESKVKSSLLSIPEIESVEVSRESSTATITMKKHIALSALQKALGGEHSSYSIHTLHHNEVKEQTVDWLKTYKPILLIFTYITVITLLIQTTNNQFDGMQWMSHFMAGFFFVFSFFKLLNISGFAESYIMYDVLARRFRAWAYIYAFTELSLGIAFLTEFNPLITNTATLIVMGISIIGVLQTVLNKRRIRCACLGDIFNLPMSTVTIIEDGLMIAMSSFMILRLI